MLSIASSYCILTVSRDFYPKIQDVTCTVNGKTVKMVQDRDVVTIYRPVRI